MSLSARPPAANLFYFEWHVDQHGYEIVDEPSVAGEVLLTSRPRHWMIRRKGGPLRAYRPLEDHPGLFMEFAQCPPTAEGACKFATLYGLLGTWVDTEPPAEEGLSKWLEKIEDIRDLALTAHERMERGEPLSALATDFNKRFAPLMAGRLEAAEGRRPHWVVSPLTLYGAIVYQLADLIAGSRKFRQCRACPTWFQYGPGTGHRETKLYCSDRCRVAWNSTHKEA